MDAFALEEILFQQIPVVAEKPSQITIARKWISEQEDFSRHFGEERFEKCFIQIGQMIVRESHRNAVQIP